MSAQRTRAPAWTAIQTATTPRTPASVPPASARLRCGRAVHLACHAVHGTGGWRTVLRAHRRVTLAQAPVDSRTTAWCFVETSENCAHPASARLATRRAVRVCQHPCVLRAHCARSGRLAGCVHALMRCQSQVAHDVRLAVACWAHRSPIRSRLYSAYRFPAQRCPKMTHTRRYAAYRQHYRMHRCAASRTAGVCADVPAMPARLPRSVSHQARAAGALVAVDVKAGVRAARPRRRTLWEPSTLDRRRTLGGGPRMWRCRACRVRASPRTGRRPTQAPTGAAAQSHTALDGVRRRPTNETACTHAYGDVHLVHMRI